MNKEVKKIFWVLGLYALSGGIFYNFLELWMASNSLSVKTIGTVYSICALLSVSTIFLCSNLIKQNKLKKFTCLLLLIKTIVLFTLFALNNSGLDFLIKFLIMIDYVADVEIYVCIYPMITLITKNDKIYAARGLVYSFLYYIGVAITSFLIGKSLFNMQIGYNFYCLFAAIVMSAAFAIMCKVNLGKYYKNIEKKQGDETLLLANLFKKIKTDKISTNYLLFVLTGEAAYYCVTGLTITLLTKYLSFGDSAASNMNFVLGILSAVLGSVILAKLTTKNDYINFSIKFVSRLIAYLIAATISVKIPFLLALIVTKVFADSYSHITDAPYINRYDGKYQLAFCNLREMIKYFSRAIGTYLCGMAISINVKYIFVIAALVQVAQIIFGLRALQLRKTEEKQREAI